DLAGRAAIAGGADPAKLARELTAECPDGAPLHGVERRLVLPALVGLAAIGQEEWALAVLQPAAMPQIAPQLLGSEGVERSVNILAVLGVVEDDLLPAGRQDGVAEPAAMEDARHAGGGGGGRRGAGPRAHAARGEAGRRR